MLSFIEVGDSGLPSESQLQSLITGDTAITLKNSNSYGVNHFLFQLNGVFSIMFTFSSLFTHFNLDLKYKTENNLQNEHCRKYFWLFLNLKQNKH